MGEFNICIAITVRNSPYIVGNSTKDFTPLYYFV